MRRLDIAGWIGDKAPSRLEGGMDTNGLGVSTILEHLVNLVQSGTVKNLVVGVEDYSGLQAVMLTLRQDNSEEIASLLDTLCDHFEDDDPETSTRAH